MPEFRYLPPGERRARLPSLGIPVSTDDLALLERGGLDDRGADQLIENAVGVFALPLGVGLNLRVNGRDYVIPMAVEEASVVAAQSHAAKLVGRGGGFESEVSDPVMIAQLQLLDVADPDLARTAIEGAEAELSRAARAVLPGIHARGGDWRGLEVRTVTHPEDGERFLVVHLLVDVRDAQGANMCNTLAESLSDRIAELACGRPGLRILSNLAVRRRVRTRCRIPLEHLPWKEFAAEDVAGAVVAASRFAEADPFRAATHNKGIMNGIDALLVATGNDWRAVEAAAHAWAARTGTYRPLSRFFRDEAGALMGELDMPMPVAIVGGAAGPHPLARRWIEWMGIRTATELAALAGAVGLSQNLAALKALGTEGIQRGHMALHRRRLERASCMPAPSGKNG